MQVTHKNGLEMESRETSLNQIWNKHASYWPLVCISVVAGSRKQPVLPVYMR